MSRYFQTLNRLRSRPDIAPAELAPGFDEPAATATLPVINVQSAGAQASFSKLLEGIRLAAQTTPSRSVVIAGVSSHQAARNVVAGLQTLVRQKPLEMAIGELAIADGRRFLRFHRSDSSAEPTTHRSQGGPPAHSLVPVELGSGSLAEVLTQTVNQLEPRADIAALLGPPIVQSVDAAMLASATAGLVLVVETLATTRADLFLALERVARAGSKPLGIVPVGVPAALPRWLRRSLYRSSQ